MRQRTLKPSWLDNERLASEADDVRLLSAALILMADDFGNGRGAPTLIRNRAWGFRNKPASEVLQCLIRLETIGYIAPYRVDGQIYYSIPSWPRHQPVKYPSKTLANPSPEDGTPATYADSSGGSPESLRKSSPKSPPTLPVERVGEERVGEERSRERSAGAAPQTPSPSGAKNKKPDVLAKHRTQAEAVWGIQEQLRSETARTLGKRIRPLTPTAKRLRKVAARLAEGNTVEDCTHVLRVFAADARRNKTLQWLNGETPWREANFTRALAQPDPEAVNGSGTGAAEPRREIWGVSE